jgi:heparosan-N-sulfate-glucuronate 5-epimerase
MGRKPCSPARGAFLPRLLTLTRGALQAALSRGPGYEPQPSGINARYDRVSGYYLDLRQKAAAELRPRVTGRGEVILPGPTATAQRALGLHESWLMGDEQALERCLEQVRDLRARAKDVGNSLLWQYEVDVPKFRQRAPWYSCMAQGQAASAFVRAHIATEEDVWAEAALSAVQPLVADGERLRLVTATPDGPALEEATTNPPSRILNGWIFALWGLWDVAVGLGDADSRALFDESAKALARMLSQYDVGWWTRYSLFPPVAPDLAKPFYHTLHVTQMSALLDMTGTAVFADAAERWSAYDRLTNRVRAVASKAPSVLRELPHARDWERSHSRSSRDTFDEHEQ